MRVMSVLITALLLSSCGSGPQVDEIVLGATLPLTGKESRA